MDYQRAKELLDEAIDALGAMDALVAIDALGAIPNLEDEVLSNKSWDLLESVEEFSEMLDKKISDEDSKEESDEEALKAEVRNAMSEVVTAITKIVADLDQLKLRVNKVRDHNFH